MADESSLPCLMAGKIQFVHKVMFMIFPEKMSDLSHYKTLQILTHPLGVKILVEIIGCDM